MVTGQQALRGAAVAAPRPPAPVVSADASPRRRALVRVGLPTVVLGYVLFSALVVAMGAGAAAAHSIASLHDQLHEWALSETTWGRVAMRMADASHSTESPVQLAIDFGFSALNLGLAVFLLRLRPNDRTAPLLAIALAGTAAIFNLQAQLVYEEVPATALEAFTHDGLHVATLLAYVVALLLFPDGRIVPRWSRPWQQLFWAVAISTVGILALRLRDDPRTIALVVAFGVLAPLAGVCSQAYRFRRSHDTVEHQLSRLLLVALVPALVVSLVALTAGVESTARQVYEGRALVVVPVVLYRVFQPVFFIIPLALLAGIFRYRLWDIDRFLSRTLLYGVLAGFVSAVYIGVVVGVGGLVGSRQQGNIPLSIAATFLVAVSFDPAKQRVQRFVNRLVYGTRATPYEVLSEFAARVAESTPSDLLLARMARLLAEGTGANRADVWLRVGDELRSAASWSPATAEVAAPVPAPVTDDVIADIAGATALVEVRHHGELFGALTVVKPMHEALNPVEHKLMTDLGSQAGLVLRNMRLTAQLLERLEELKASRQRLVAAQDEERRRLERNLHDGAQQQLVALKVHLTLAEDLVDELGDAGQPVLDLLAQLKDQATEALEQMRDLARGIYPKLLADEGLGMALSSHCRKLGFPVEVDVAGVPRFPQDMEAAVYFCCLEALQNVAKYAGSCAVRLTIGVDDGHLWFAVADDGCGFDPGAVEAGSGTQNMSDRLAALDGSVRIESAPGQGTTVTGRIPLPAQPAARP